jgi:hypothetical protein
MCLKAATAAAGCSTGRPGWKFAYWATIYFGRLFTLGDYLLWATIYFGRLFTLGDYLLWATIYFGRLITLGSFFENCRKKPQNFDDSFSKVPVTYVLILTKNGLVFFLGDCFTNSSGHPAVHGEDFLAFAMNQTRAHQGRHHFFESKYPILFFLRGPVRPFPIFFGHRVAPRVQGILILMSPPYHYNT